MISYSNSRKHKQRTMFASRLSFLLLCTGLTPASLYAQSANPAAADAADGADQLQEIVVTAQRREQNLQDTPVAVSAFNAQQLLSSGVANVRDLAHVDASLNIPSAAGVYLPFLRGIGNSAGGNVGNESSVAGYIDDVYYSRLSTAYLALGSMERVEVLKGPQGTLFGRNSSGGAIQMFTKDPGQTAEVNGMLGYANYDRLSGQLYAATPITETLGWNISLGGVNQRDGWGKSITTGEDAYLEKYATVRSKLVWEPGAGTRIKLVGFYAYSKGDMGLTQDRHSGSYGSSPNWAAFGRPFPAGYPNPAVVLPSLADVPGGHFYDNRLNFKNFQREEGYGASLRIDQEIGFADFVSISAFRNSKGQGHYDADYSAQNFFFGDLNNIDRQWSQEFQLKSRRGSAIDWIVGAFYLHSKAGYNPVQVRGDLLNALIAPGGAQNLYGRQLVNSYSVYGQATAPLSEKTNLTLGLRYTRDEVSGLGRTTATIPGVGEVPIAPNFTAARTYKRVTWKGALDHHLSDDLMAYASISRGYKAGTFNTFSLDTVPADPETVDAYEIGLKSELFDRRVRLNGAVFWNDIKNPQVLTIISKGLAVGIGLTNAQKARVKGAEVGMEAVAADGLKLRGALTYLDAKYRSFVNAPFYTLNGRTLVGPALGDASGFRLPNVPKWRLSVGANYTVETGAGTWVGDVSANHTGGFPWTADNRISEKAVTLINASLNFTPSSLDWLTVGLWGKNLGDVQHYSITQASTGPAGDIGGHISSAAAPRTYGASVSFKF
ncbi:TonB-dependent receptor [Rhizorhabdus dicambivorans]|nr:TonB-dependent receptor [Rhizorhabdus dicambivorans]